MHRFGTLFKPPALVVLMYFSESVICNNVKLSCWAGWVGGGGGKWEVGIECGKLCVLLATPLHAGSQLRTSSISASCRILITF